ncbi:tyrosine-type recombinase/integrase [Haloferax profundi]|uniref:Integrase n=1 Tax=Haloferax profundi TaxID=1544718 RepID=A0A0W1R2Y2_9EURY|nr:tyrosine-type recombinase/integrase [Haloferax profundi]KTG07563.1 integrase [Haloferax profundi]
MSKLEPLEPELAVQMYLDARRDELADWTLKSHKYRLSAFVQWCEESDIDNLNDLNGRDLYRFRVWRREGNFDVDDGEEPKPIAPVTLKSQLTTLRAFLRFCADVNAVPGDFYERVALPKISGTDDVSDSTLEPDRATAILDYLYRYHYASRKHVEFALLWETGARMGAIRGLDLRDLDLDGRKPTVRYVHRPNEGTPIKNGERGERYNSISDRVGKMLEAYIEGPRVEATDEFGRKPLLTTYNGRISASAIRQDVYSVTRPCWYSKECPHNREISTCEAVEINHVSKCPSSRSPHDVRKGVVTLYRREEVPRRVVSDRLDASDAVLDKHYDRRGERERAEQRRNHLPW